MSMIRVGFDIHGCLDKYPLLCDFTRMIRQDNGINEVHIITGHTVSEELREQLQLLKVCYTHIFSIVDYHTKLGTKIRQTKQGPFLDSYLWDRAKAEYCERYALDAHYDDSSVYGQYFKGRTLYIKV